jgi:hypothetical protein
VADRDLDVAPPQRLDQLDTQGPKSVQPGRSTLEGGEGPEAQSEQGHEHGHGNGHGHGKKHGHYYASPKNLWAKGGSLLGKPAAMLGNVESKLETKANFGGGMRERLEDTFERIDDAKADKADAKLDKLDDKVDAKADHAGKKLGLFDHDKRDKKHGKHGRHDNEHGGHESESEEKSGDKATLVGEVGPKTEAKLDGDSKPTALSTPVTTDQPNVVAKGEQPTTATAPKDAKSDAKGEEAKFEDAEHDAAAAAGAAAAGAAAAAHAHGDHGHGHHDHGHHDHHDHDAKGEGHHAHDDHGHGDHAHGHDAHDGHDHHDHHDGGHDEHHAAADGHHAAADGHHTAGDGHAHDEHHADGKQGEHGHADHGKGEHDGHGGGDHGHGAQAHGVNHGSPGNSSGRIVDAFDMGPQARDRLAEQDAHDFRKGHQIVVHSLHEANKKAKAHFAGQVAHHHGMINGRAAAARGTLTSSAGRQIGVIGGAVASAKGVVAGAISRAIGRVTTSAGQARQGVNQWHTQAAQKVTQAFNKTAQAIVQAGNQGGTKAQQLTTQASNKATTQINSMATRAQSIGGGLHGSSSIAEAAEKKAKLASELTKDAVEKIKEGLPGTTASFAQQGPQVADALRKAGTDASTKLKAQMPKVLKQMTELQHSAIKSIEQAQNQAKKGLTSMRTKAIAGISSVGRSGQGNVNKVKGQRIAQVSSSAAKANQLFEAGKQKVLGTSDRTVEAAIQKLPKKIRARDAKKISRPLVANLRSGFKKAETKARTGANKSAGALSRTASSGAAAMAGVARSTSANARKVASGASSAAARAADQAAQGMQKIRTQTVTTGNQAVQKATQALDKAQTKFENGIEKELTKYGSKLDGQITKAVNAAKKPLDNLASRITSGQAKIEAKAQEEKAKKHKRNIFQKAWDAATGWLKAFGEWIQANWEIIAIVAIAVLVTVATLGVGTLIAGALTSGVLLAQVAAAAVIGMVGGGLTKLLQNHHEGKGWSMDGVVKAGLVGGAFNAISFGASGALASRGASAVTQFGANEAITGANTITSNVVQGDGWSDGLALDLFAGGVGNDLGIVGEVRAGVHGASHETARAIGRGINSGGASLTSQTDDIQSHRK